MTIVPPPVLSGQNAVLCERLSATLKRTSNWFSTVLQDKYSRHGISSQQYYVLVLLREVYPQVVTLKFLKKNVIEKNSDVSRIVDKLLQKGLVERKACHIDRRRVDIKISEKGMALTSQIMAHDEAQRLFLNLNTEEATLLNELLNKLTAQKQA